MQFGRSKSGNVRYLNFPWRIMAFAMRRAMALHGLPRAVMVLDDDAMGVPWISMAISWGRMARYFMACHEKQYGYRAMA